MTPWKRRLLAIGVLQFALATSAWAQESPQQTQWESSMAAGAAAFRQGNFPQVEKQYKAAVAEAEKFGRNDLRVATSLISLAGLQFEIPGPYGYTQRRYHTAGPLLARALKIMETAHGREDPSLLGILDILPPIYFGMEKYAQGARYSERALAIREKTLGPEHLDVADNLDSLAHLYRNRKTKSTLDRYSKPAYRGPVVDSGGDRAGRRTPQDYELGVSGSPTRDLVSGSDREQIKSAANAALAEPLFKRAAAIREKALGAEHPKYILSLVNLTICYANQNKKKRAEAEATAQRMWEILEKAHEQTPNVLVSAATAMRAVGRKDEAEQLEAKARAKAK